VVIRVEYNKGRERYIIKKNSPGIFQFSEMKERVDVGGRSERMKYRVGMSSTESGKESGGVRSMSKGDSWGCQVSEGKGKRVCLSSVSGKDRVVVSGQL
jgi:hypothetical protein